MSGTVNKVMLVGYIVKSPVLTELSGGNKKATFTLVTQREWVNDKEELKSITEWHRVICYGKLAESIEKRALERNLVYVEGRIQTRTWEENGRRNYITEIIIPSGGRFMTIRTVKNTAEVIGENAEINPEELNEEQKEALMIDEIEKMLMNDIGYQEVEKLVVPE